MNKTNKISFFSLYLLCFVCMITQSFYPVRAEKIQGLDLPLKSEGTLLFYADVYQFETADDRLRIEVCYSLDLSQLKIQNQPRDEYTFSLMLQFIDNQGQTVKDVFDKKKIANETLQSNMNTSFLDLLKFNMMPDTVKFVLSISDSISGKTGVIDKIIEFQRFSDELSISDPVFITDIRKASGEKNIFTRQNVLMIPNPARLFNASSDKNYFYIYFDINNLDYDPDLPSLYRLECSIDDLTGKSINKIEHSQLKKVSANTSRIEKLSMEQLTTGMYCLKIQIADLSNDKTASSRRYFSVISKEKGTSLLMPMEEEDIEKYYDQIKYIATNRESNIYQQLDNVGKQEFLLQFWKSKDPTPDTPENEFMLQHFQRIDYCEKHFNKGINSDRGRIYIQYGPPVDLERNVSTLGYSRPVEIWTYSINGRVEFVFVDRTNDDNYMLMHSTHPDEYYNPGWTQEFQAGN